MSIKRNENKKLDIFMDEASNTWSERIKPLEKDSPARHPYGYVAYGIEINGKLKDFSPPEFLKILEEVGSVKYYGWPPFIIAPEGHSMRPYDIGNQTIECWLGKESSEVYTTDFWRASTNGFLYLQRGYKEDFEEDLEPRLTPGLVLIANWAISLTAEIICYSHRLAQEICLDNEKISINLRAKYTGLEGRFMSNYSEKQKTYESLLGGVPISDWNSEKLPVIWDKKLRFKSDIVKMDIDNIKLRMDKTTNQLHLLVKIVHDFLKPLYSNVSYENEFTRKCVEKEIKKVKLKM